MNQLFSGLLKRTALCSLIEVEGDDPSHIDMRMGDRREPGDHVVREHGRATPLVWLTVDKKTLKDQRNLYEDRVLVRLAEILPQQINDILLRNDSTKLLKMG